VDAALARLIGTAIGAQAGLTASLVSARQHMRSEREKLQAARMDELVKADRQALLHLTQLHAAGTQAISWLSWAAGIQSDHEIREEIAVYEARMRQLQPELLAAEAAAASQSDEAFDRIDPLVNELMEIDAEVATAGARFDHNPDEVRSYLAEVGQHSRDLAVRRIQVIRELLRRGH
jgi:hypothetical protein